eukprot:TRINITY_DN4728_c0_g1_i1.p1 TRINITY_DN4728_c0_g1~~TRINITY_DN4728_c0_g1_i1.p1  ORF type:complete len:664 (+),score=86.66 TRINITY_DN4728_c0_g1_i1:55-2046(+)
MRPLNPETSSDEDLKHVGGHEDPESDEERTGSRGHHCTDIPCCIIFLAALVPLYFIVGYSFSTGDMRKIYHGYDFLGRLCGVDTSNSTVKTDLQSSDVLGKVLYYCPKEQTNLLTGTMSLDLEHPICLDSCPTKADVDNVVTTSCYDKAVTTTGVANADGTFTAETTYIFKKMPVYQSHAFAGRYCYPTDPGLLAQLKKVLTANWTTKWIVSLSGVWNARWMLLISAVLAFFLGYAYLCCVNWCAKPLVYICMLILLLAPLISGIYLLVVSLTSHDGLDGVPSTGDSQWDTIIGICLCAVGVVFFVIICCAHSAVNRAIACIQAACECIFDMPTLLLQPLFSLIIHGFWTALMLSGFFYLVSCGNVTQTSLQEYVAGYDVGSANISGISRSFTFSQDQLEMLAYYIFMMMWVSEICNSFSQFVLAYAVQIWYFTPYDEDGDKETPWCPLCRGYRIGLMYHLGTLTFGALLIAILRFIRLILGQLAKQANESGNKAAACAAKACICVVTCFEKCLKFLNKNAYMDVAITSSDFCTAARRAMKVIAENVATIAILNGATWVFFFAGIGAITSAGAYLTWLLVTDVPYFNDPTQDHYVANPVMTTIVAGIISAAIAWAFMIVFDTVSDTVLYCYATEYRRRQKGEIGEGVQFAPPKLDELVREDLS